MISGTRDTLRAIPWERQNYIHKITFKRILKKKRRIRALFFVKPSNIALKLYRITYKHKQILKFTHKTLILQIMKVNEYYKLIFSIANNLLS
jgi:hypothetical protein